MKRILLCILATLGINFGAKSQTEKLDSGLKKTLKITANRFENKNHIFVINLVKDNVVEFQIVHGAIIEQIATPTTNEFNFALNLPFDNEQEALEEFKKLKIANEFKYYEYDEIPCFALSFGNNQKVTYDVALEILNKVYGFENSDIFEFEIFDQGALRK